MLKAYLIAAGRNPTKFVGTTKVDFAGELITILESEEASKAQWSPAAGKLEFR